MRNIAAILAGGTGSRMGGSEPKQFMLLEGKPIVAHSVEVFEKAGCIDEIAIVVHPEWRGRMEAIVREQGWRKVKRIIDGGEERYRSSYNAVMAYSDMADDTNLMIHDAARPWLKVETVEAVAEALRKNEAVGVATASTDTVWEVEEGIVKSVPDRARMWLAQTPQAFRLPVIREAYRMAMNDDSWRPTDDCSVVRRYRPEVAIAVVDGGYENRKITYKTDI